MFTVVDLGYFERRSGSNWIAIGLLGAIELKFMLRQGDRSKVCGKISDEYTYSI
ncbi:hypothetical protein [Microcoleus asticus]|uniref:hypothetical protein n=1 Tax=Microcoleus asticus TaxID=2815231 RepID=UPI001553137F|nr:hypothetical protein [Microcoleus asticus]